MGKASDPADVADDDKVDKNDHHNSVPRCGLGEASPTVGQDPLEEWETLCQAIVHLEVPLQGSIPDSLYWSLYAFHHLSVSVLEGIRQARME
jgi:hypothetical protein